MVPMYSNIVHAPDDFKRFISAIRRNGIRNDIAAWDSCCIPNSACRDKSQLINFRPANDVVKVADHQQTISIKGYGDWVLRLKANGKCYQVVLPNTMYIQICLPPSYRRLLQLSVVCMPVSGNRQLG